MSFSYCALAGLFLLGGPPLSASPTATGSKWILTAPLNAARTYGSATLLRDGRVLVTGGYGGSCDLASTEIYTPSEGTFSRAADMSQGRSDQTATLLARGKVLVAGGECNGVVLASAELYDPSTNSWTATGSMHLPRQFHDATLLSDGRVMVTGGVQAATPPVFAQGAPRGSALTVTEIYDPASGTWSATGNMNTARYVHTATLLRNGDVLVAGGMGSRLHDPESFGPPSIVPAIASAEIYHHQTGEWTEIAPLSSPRFEPTATLLRNGDVLVAGGQSDGVCCTSAELYHPATGSWKATGSLRTARNGHTANLLPDGRVLVVGGANTDGVLTDTEIYHPATRAWTVGASLNTPHCLHTATLLPNGSVLVVGGGYALGLPTYNQISAELYAVAKKSAAPVVAPEAQPETTSEPQAILPGVD